MINIDKQSNGNVWITDNDSGDIIRILPPTLVPYTQLQSLYFGLGGGDATLDEINSFNVEGVAQTQPTTLNEALILLSEKYFFPKLSGSGSSDASVTPEQLNNKIKSISLADYTALTQSQKTNGTLYLIPIA